MKISSRLAALFLVILGSTCLGAKSEEPSKPTLSDLVMLFKASRCAEFLVASRKTSLNQREFAAEFLKLPSDSENYFQIETDEGPVLVALKHVSKKGAFETTSEQLFSLSKSSKTKVVIANAHWSKGAVRALIRSIITQIGFRVSVAGSGLFAIKMITQAPNQELKMMWFMGTLAGTLGLFWTYVHATKKEDAYEVALVKRVKESKYINSLSERENHPAFFSALEKSVHLSRRHSRSGRPSVVWGVTFGNPPPDQMGEMEGLIKIGRTRFLQEMD